MKRKLADWIKQWGMFCFCVSLVAGWEACDAVMRWILSWGFFWGRLPHSQSEWVVLSIPT